MPTPRRTPAIPSSVLDHDPAPEWETAFFSDFCLTCGWPVSRAADGPWTHDPVNPCLWRDRRATKP